MALVNGTNYDHIDLHAASGGDVTRHKLQDTDGRAMVAPTEASSTASAAHPAGSYFIYNNTLYQATAGIASGGTITPNTNCKAVTLGSDVSDLKSALSDFVCYKEPAAAVQFEQGSFNSSGEEVASTVAIRSSRYYNYRADRLYRITCADGYKMGFRAWNDAGTYLGLLYDDGVFRTSGSGVTAQIAQIQGYDAYKYPDYNIRLVLYKYNGGSTMLTITPSDATNNITFVYADVYGQTFKREDKTVELGGVIYKPFSGTTFGKQINPPTAYPRITGRIPYPTRAISAFVPVHAGATVIVYPGSGKCGLQVIDGTLDYTTYSALHPSAFGTDPVIYRAIADQFVAGRWTNLDDTTVIDPDTCGGYMIVSDCADRNNLALSGKRISVMGDSISAYDGYIPSGALTYYPREDVTSWQQMYWGRLATEYDMTLDTINAYAGTNVATKWQETERVSFIEESRLSNLGTPDFIVIEGGTNDFGGNPLGEYPAWDTYTNLYEFRTAYAYLLNQLKIRYPSARIICLTIMANNGYNTVSGHYPEKQDEIKQALATDTTTHFLYEFNESIKELCKRYECYVCDISDLMNYYNSSDEAIGGVHPKAMTHQRIANRIANVLKTLSYH